MWRWIISLLVWLSSDPAAVDLERAKAAAAVAAARAKLRRLVPRLRRVDRAADLLKFPAQKGL